MTRFSVIMPAYNSEKTISNAIDSVVNQSFYNWELIIVDDGSIDNTKKICEEYIGKDERIKYYHRENSGPGASRNFAISKSNGEFIAFLDSDDYWNEHFLELIYKSIEGNNSDLVFYDVVREDKNGTKLSISSTSKYKHRSKEDLLILQIAGSIEWGMTKVVKSSIIKNNSLSFSSDNVGEEALFSADLLYYCNNVSFVERSIYHYVDDVNGQHRKGDINPWGKTVQKMSSHVSQYQINNQNLINVGINSLALKALCININRICNRYSYSVAKTKIKEAISEYSVEYKPFLMNRKYLLKTIHYVGVALKLHLYFMVYLMSKIRRKKNG